MSVLDLVGRQIDILAFQGATPGRNVEMTQVLIPDDLGGYSVAGIEKLVQRFLLILLTEMSSMTYLPETGTRFLSDARRGGWRTTADVIQSFASALVDLRRQMASLERDDDPLDERFADAVLLNVTLTPDLVAITVQLNSLSGEQRRFITPVAVIIKEGRT